MLKDEVSEAEYLEEQSDGGASDDMLELEIEAMRERYDTNEYAKCKTWIECAYCEKQIIKTTYHKKFCSTICKDKYWNVADDERHLRVIRFNS